MFVMPQTTQKHVSHASMHTRYVLSLNPIHASHQAQRKGLVLPAPGI